MQQSLSAVNTYGGAIKKKYLFLYLNTGGGHRAPALAVAGQLEQYYGDEVEVQLADGFADANKALKDLIEKGYKFLQNTMPWFYEFIYAVNKISFFSKSSINNITRLIQKDIDKLILASKPDKIVIFHFFLIKPVLNVLKKHHLNLPVLTLVTDPITPPPIWFHEHEIDYILFSNDARKAAMKINIHEKKLNVFPFVLSDKYSQVMSKKEIRAFKTAHKMRPTKPLILLIGGADGIPKGRKLLKRLVNVKIDADIAIVCGRNASLYNKCIIFKEKNKGYTINVYGFVDFVYELINSADLIISKCGASTFMEILLSKKIPIINRYLWEQEKGNVDFITKNNLGVFEKSSRRIADLCKTLLADKKTLLNFKTNIDNAELVNGNREVAQFIRNYRG